MIEFIFELLFRVVLEIVAQVVFEVLAALGFESVRQPDGEIHRPRPVLAAFAQFLLGVAAGGLSLFIIDWKVTAHSPLPGVSLLLSPLGTGAAMHLLGELWRDRRDVPALFTFRAGAICAFGMALMRFVYLELGWTPF